LTRSKLSAPWLAPLALALGCDPRITSIGTLDAGRGQYLEAEDGALSGGFEIDSDPNASAGRFISPAVGTASEDAPGPARAAYELNAETAGTYLIWGRMHSQNIDQNRFFLQVDGGEWIKWRITTGDIWFWDAIHLDVDYGNPIPFDLTAGVHQLVFANAVDGARLDRLYYAPDRSEPEGNQTLCNPPHTVQLDGVCNPSCGVMAGLCGGSGCVGLPSKPTYDCAACCIPDQ
jgi:hypothetical protein